MCNDKKLKYVRYADDFLIAVNGSKQDCEWAYAGGGPEWEGLDPAEGTTAPEPTIEPGGGFTKEGSLVTRDLLYDKHTNKQFITVQTSGGSTFYIVIDYDKPTDEDAEQYETYFFSVVDEANLLAALEASRAELPECTCAEKCVAGAINMGCPVCGRVFLPNGRTRYCSPGCARAANLKRMAAALQFMQEHQISEYSQLTTEAEAASARFHALTEQLRQTEADLAYTSELMGTWCNTLRLCPCSTSTRRPSTANGIWPSTRRGWRTAGRPRPL